MATLYYRPFSSEPVQDGELPPHNAIGNILPEYQYIFTDPNQDTRGQPSSQTKPLEELDRTPLHVLDYQMRELEKYRTAVHRMGKDILDQRQQMRELEIENSQLRRNLAQNHDATKLLLDSSELDGLTKPELVAKYVAVKQKLLTQTADVKSYKEKVQLLQNDLIKKNDKEKQLVKISDAHTSQQDLIRRLQDRAQKSKKLEEAMRKQEKVIQKMEKLLSTKGSSGKDIDTQRANDALQEENRRLRAVVDDLRDQQRHQTYSRDDEEKLELYKQIEKQKGRIESLEQQLNDNARKWAKERSDLTLRAKEAENGFRRTSPLYRDYPKLASRSYEPERDEARRFSKAPPRTRKNIGRRGSSNLIPIYQ